MSLVTEAKAAGRVLVLRTCSAELKAQASQAKGFQYPESGPVEAPDWAPTKACGAGLHGLLWGIGDLGLLSADHDAKYMLLSVDPADGLIELDDKVKFRRGNVVFVGPWVGAFAVLREHWFDGIPGTRGHASAAGDSGHASAAGYRGHASAAGDSGHASAAGYSGHASAAGYSGHASAAGYRGIAACLGSWGQAQAGEKGVVVVAWYDEAGDRPRVVVGHVGEGGVKPLTWYRANERGHLVELTRENGDDVLELAPPVAQKAAPKKRAARRSK